MNKMKKQLYQTYKKCNPNYQYEPKLRPKRYLTHPSTPTIEYPYDNREANYILFVNDVIIAPQNRFILS